MTFLTLNASLTHPLVHEQLGWNVPLGSICPFVFECVFGQLLESVQITKLSSFMGAW